MGKLYFHVVCLEGRGLRADEALARSALVSTRSHPRINFRYHIQVLYCRATIVIVVLWKFSSYLCLAELIRCIRPYLSSVSNVLEYFQVPRVPRTAISPLTTEVTFATHGTEISVPTLLANSPAFATSILTSLSPPGVRLVPVDLGNDIATTPITTVEVGDKTTTPKSAVPGASTQIEEPRSLSVPQRGPIVKTLLYGTGDKRIRSTEDVNYVWDVCKNHVEGFDSDNLRVHLGGGKVGEEYDWFFSPEDIVPGDMLILLISGHATLGPSPGTVTLQLKTPEGIPIDTHVLREAITKLPSFCTLEIMIGTCYSEEVVGGLHRVWVAEPFPASNTPLSDTYGTFPAPRRDSNRGVVCDSTNLQTPPPQPETSLPLFRLLASQVIPAKPQATVIVWAAAIKNGLCWTEAEQPGNPETHCIMIGAICRALKEKGTNITRRALCALVGNAARRENVARRERDLNKSEERRARLGPRVQTPVLLSSDSNSDRILDGYVFRPLPEI